MHPQSGQTSLHPGQMVGRYRLIELAGRGGMGVVWRAYDDRLDRTVAIKFIRPDYALDAQARENFEREARAIVRLDHPNILTILEAGDQDEWLYMVSPYIGGGTLADRMSRGAWNVEETLPVLESLAAALDYAHGERIVHRDVKPGNVLFTDRGRLVLSDFGLARVMDTSTHASQTKTVGTPHYIAPEQATGTRIGPASDLYSLGVIAYQMLTGRLPFERDSAVAVALAHVKDPPPPPRSINPELSEAVEYVLLTMLAKVPAERYPSGHAFVAALAQTSRSDTGPATAPGWTQATAWTRPASARVTATTGAYVTTPPPPPLPSTVVRHGNRGSAPAQWIAIAVAVAVVGLLAVWFAGGSSFVRDTTPAPTATAIRAVQPTSTAQVAAAPEPTATSIPPAQAAVPATATPALALAASPAVVESIARVAPSPTEAVTAAPSPTPIPPTAVPTVNPAVALEKEGDALLADNLGGAVEKYRAAVSQDPTNPVLMRKLGIALWSLDVNREWLPTLEEAARLDPNDGLAWAYLASSYMSDYQYDKLAAAADRAAQLAPGGAETHAVQGLKHFTQSEFGLAHEEVMQALAINPDSMLAVNVYLVVRSSEIDDANYAEALDVARRAVEHRPRWAVTRTWLGAVQAARGENDQARRTYEAALAIEPEVRTLHSSLADLEIGDGRMAQAEAAYQFDLDHDPRAAYAMTGLAGMAASRGDHAQADKLLRRAIEIDPRMAAAYLFLGVERLNVANDLDGAEAMFRKSLDIWPAFGASYIGLGRIQGARGDWNAALASFQLAIHAVPSNGYGYAFTGDALMWLGRFPEARPYLEKAKAMGTDLPLVQQDLDDLKRRGV